MKRSLCSVVFAFVAYAQLQPPSQTPSKNSQVKQQGADSKSANANNHVDVPPISVTVNAPVTQEQTDHRQDSSSSEHIIEVLTGVIALAAIAQAIIYALQTGVMKSTLAATRIAAEAANRSIDLMIAKERSRIKIDVQEVPLENPLPHMLNWMVTNNGGTKAFITHARSRAFCVVYDQPRPDVSQFVTENPALYLSPIKPDGTQTVEALIAPGRGADAHTEISEGRTTLYFYAWVKYQDAFGRHHSKVLLKLQPIPEWASREQGTSMWIRVEENPADNQET